MNTEKNAKSLATCWGLIHGANDLAAGYMLANFSLTNAKEDGLVMLMIYAILGFGGQLPLALWIDRQKSFKSFVIFSLILLLISIACFSFSPVVAIIMTGIAGAGIHVCGGAICLQVNKGKSGILGIFTAPGVLGLTLGGLVGNITLWPLLFAGCFVLILCAWVAKLGFPSYRVQAGIEKGKLDLHDWIMLGILLIMCCRSFIFDILNFVANDHQYGALILGLSAFAGKLAGGFLADKFGWKRFAYCGLVMGLIFLSFGRENIFALGFGIACLQSSVPVTLMLMSLSLPMYPATASALSLGTAVAFAGLPFYLVGRGIAMHSANYTFTVWIFLLMLSGWVFISFYKKQRIRLH